MMINKQIMEKMYIQPEMMVSPVAPQTIICASGEFENTDQSFGGQAPAREQKAF